MAGPEPEESELSELPPGKKPRIAKPVVGSEDPVLDAAAEALEDLFAKFEVPESHGLGHALRVLQHVDKALAIAAQCMLPSRRQAVRLAALLHDADDRKLFKTDVEACNARNIMQTAGADADVVSEALRMISLVSCNFLGTSR